MRRRARAAISCRTVSKSSIAFSHYNSKYLFPMNYYAKKEWSGTDLGLSRSIPESRLPTVGGVGHTDACLLRIELRQAVPVRLEHLLRHAADLGKAAYRRGERIV